MKRIFEALLNLFYPRCCIVCGELLVTGEEKICTLCDIKLPRTNFHLIPDNKMEQLFWGKINIVRATAFFYYRKGSSFRPILFSLKYRGDKEIGECFGRRFASEIYDTGFFNTIDLIVPIPLHPHKLKTRGYNQSDFIAKGIASVTHIPLCCHSVIREKDSETQTRKSQIERIENVKGIFSLVDSPSFFEGKHILLIDDVVTTGATILSCAEAFKEVNEVSFSVLTLGIAGD